LITLLRLVALLLAEARGLCSPGVSVTSTWERLCEHGRQAGLSFAGSLFDDASFPALTQIDDAVLHRCLAQLLDERGPLPVERLGEIYESLLGYELILSEGPPQLRPGQARRRAGAHYTPQSLSEPVVRACLRPLLAEWHDLDDDARAHRLSQLRVCDPAMGTGAFLLEAWRQLSALLGAVIPEASTESAAVLAARTLHGVDIDPVAVALARLSLWLAVADPRLTPDAFDQRLRCGDALVGMGPDGRPHKTLARPHQPLHWPLEFPEVFTGDNPGFDLIVGNPPFLGGRNLSAALGSAYLRHLIAHTPGASGGTDLSAYFLRRAHDLLRRGGCLGLITTNTISQGDTQIAGLAVLRAASSCIYEARRRLPWPGLASVIVSIVHCRRGEVAEKILDGHPVDDITAFLMPSGPDLPPARLAANAKRCFQGNIVLGVGFTFADGDPRANSLEDMQALLAADPRN
ncbi:MAG: N-6 DNA methylase, partial [Myxococcales bacterium]|nr:N-6 DNA methylase [Myxococcales bacterium]